MRTIVMSDLHGCLSQFETMLDLLGFETEHDRLFLLGDYVDRGPQILETVERVRRLVREHGVMALRGNHDHRFAEIALSGDLDDIGGFLQFGGVETLRSYAPDFVPDSLSSVRRAFGKVRGEYMEHLEFLSNLPLWHEDERHIYVHAGINPAYADWKTQPDSDFMWIRNAFFERPTGLQKTVVFGHTVTETLHGKPDIWFDGDKIGIDGGCAYGLQLNALVIENSRYYAHKVAAGR